MKGFFLFLSIICPIQGFCESSSSNITFEKSLNQDIKRLQVKHDFITNPDNDNYEKIEFFYLQPIGKGPFPVIFLIHGSQPPNHSLGAKQLIDLGYLEKFANEGILPVAISMPGFGHSDVIRDFAGPKSQKAVAEVINHFSLTSLVNPNKMGIYGISKGAILASMIHIHNVNLMLQILESGSYDLPLRQSQLPLYLNGILQSMLDEAGDSIEALKQRSAVYHTHNISAKTLILHGEIDDRKGLFSARKLHNKLLDEGKNSVLEILSKTPHTLPKEKWSLIIPFVRENFLNLYGIGIRITKTKPAIQIAEIKPGSPAESSKQLKKGDAILKISPNNDDRKIDTLNMSVHDFTQLMLGAKDTSLSLYVQHLDLTYDEIVIKRG